MDEQAPGVRRAHIPAVDVVRNTTVLTVVCVHATSVLVPPGDAGAAGAVLTVFHSSREIFLVLSALVLTWSVGDRPLRPGPFWRRRVPLVLGPYVAWSVVYFVAGGAGGGVAHLAVDLLDAGAHFHLYFLLLTLQLYLVLPWVLPWLRARAQRPWRLLVTSICVELAFTAVVHWQIGVPPPLSWLASHPGTWLPSYQLYVVAGVLVGLHVEAVTAWCARHLASLAAAAGATVAASLAAYAAAVLGGAAAVHASEVFQPAVVAESLVLGALELGAGSRLCARAEVATLRRLAWCSDISFGVYLLHPLLLQVVQGPVRSQLATLPAAVAVATVVVVVVPTVAAASALAVHLLRSTPVSLLATGRSRLAPVHDGGAGAPPAPVVTAWTARPGAKWS